jgi:mannitol-1-phosphate 5-dehydrogenase
VMEQPLVAIIGAGKTGRGFIARFVMNSGFQLVFLDISKELVGLINEQGSYAIHYFDEGRSVVRIAGVRAVLMNTAEADRVLDDAIMVFTAVGEQNLIHVAQYLQQYFLGSRADSRPPFPVLTCENGIHPGRILQDMLRNCGVAEHQVAVAEAAVFCTTVEMKGTALDIISEPYDELPYDEQKYQGVQLAGMVPVPNFRLLLKRKIYTYNCLSACLAYLGWMKGHVLLSEAANDADVRLIVDSITCSLNRALCMKFKTDPEDQQRFSESALNKFSNPKIRDDITRNARDVLRKLGPEDRLIAPALMILETGGSIDGLAHVIASAICYACKFEPSVQGLIEKEGINEAFATICGLSLQHPLMQRVSQYLSDNSR